VFKILGMNVGPVLN